MHCLNAHHLPLPSLSPLSFPSLLPLPFPPPNSVSSSRMWTLSSMLYLPFLEAVPFQRPSSVSLTSSTYRLQSLASRTTRSCTPGRQTGEHVASSSSPSTLLPLDHLPKVLSHAGLLFISSHQLSHCVLGSVEGRGGVGRGGKGREGEKRDEKGRRGMRRGGEERGGEGRRKVAEPLL